MKYMKLLYVSIIVCTLTGCSQYLANIYDAIRMAPKENGTKAASSFDGENRAPKSREDFFGEITNDIIVLEEEDAQTFYSDLSMPQSKHVPGSKSSPIPSIASFSDPSKAEAQIFRKIHFNTDQHTPKSKEDYVTIHRIAAFMKKHPSIHVFIVGHCDERASEAYNLALGTRRANHIRSLLIKEGVPGNRLFTLSRGKEQPEDAGHNATSWARNRRVNFKIYQQS